MGRLKSHEVIFPRRHLCCSERRLYQAAIAFVLTVVVVIARILPTLKENHRLQATTLLPAVASTTQLRSRSPSIYAERGEVDLAYPAAISASLISLIAPSSPNNEDDTADTEKALQRNPRAHRALNPASPSKPQAKRNAYLHASKEAPPGAITTTASRGPASGPASHPAEGPASGTSGFVARSSALATAAATAATATLPSPPSPRPFMLQPNRWRDRAAVREGGGGEGGELYGCPAAACPGVTEATGPCHHLEVRPSPFSRSAQSSPPDFCLLPWSRGWRRAARPRRRFIPPDSSQDRLRAHAAANPTCASSERLLFGRAPAGNRRRGPAARAAQAALEAAGEE